MTANTPHLKQLNLNEAQQDPVFKIMHEQAPTMRSQPKLNEQLHAIAQVDRFDDAKAQQLTE